MNNVRNDKLLKKFGMHLRSLRGVMEMSQEELANAANIPISQIGRIERVEVNLTLSTLDALADALEIRLNELLIF